MAKGGAPLDQLEAVARRIAPFGWHVQMYVTPEIWRELYPLILRLPVPVVIDHMGQITPDRMPADAGLDAVLRLLDSGRAWIKLIAYRVSLAGPPYRDVTPIAQTGVRIPVG
jgi:predicted TIM-barrel fold metal-dependent hydrolase